MRPWRLAFKLWYGFAAVVLPIITLVFENLTKGSADLLIDPIPTWFHQVAVASVPLASLWLWWVERDLGRRNRFRIAVPVVFGLALGITSFYAVAYLPATPLAIPGILFVGIGLLPLSPLLGFIALNQLRLRWDAEGPLGGGRNLRRALIAAFAVMLVTFVEPLLSWRIVDGIEADGTMGAGEAFWVREVIGEEDFAEAARRGRIRAPYEEFLGSFHRRHSWPERRDALHHAYYRVFDGDWEMVSRGGRSSWDPNRGTKKVGAIQSGLSLESAEWTTRLEAAERVGYGEWTLRWANTAPFEQEARAVVELPPGAVVSRVTLWVNGEPREGVFSAPGKVTRAYQSVAIRQRRDPLLVTWRSPDRVFLQCFPVLPADTMQVRLGISFPTTVDGSVASPAFVRRNFALREETPTVPPVRESRGRMGADLEFDGVLVVSLSARDHGHREAVAELIARHRGAGAVWVTGLGRYSSAAAAAQAVRNHRVSGGTDVVPLLAEALTDIARSGLRLRWIAGSQVHLIADPSTLAGSLGKQRAEVWRLPAVSNRVVEAEPVIAWRQCALVEKGGHLIPFTPARTQFSGYDDAMLAELSPRETDRPSRALGTYQAIMRAWRLQRQSGVSGSEEERLHWGALAAAARLVTPWSGAVVLETDAQYAEQGLKASGKASAQQTGVIPEPAIIGLLASLVVIALVAIRRRR